MYYCTLIPPAQYAWWNISLASFRESYTLSIFDTICRIAAPNYGVTHEEIYGSEGKSALTVLAGWSTHGQRPLGFAGHHYFI